MAEISLAEMRKENVALAKALGEMDLRASIHDILRIGHETTSGRFGDAHIPVISNDLVFEMHVGCCECLVMMKTIFSSYTTSSYFLVILLFVIAHHQPLEYKPLNFTPSF